jgi:hypothetical protein
MLRLVSLFQTFQHQKLSLSILLSAAIYSQLGGFVLIKSCLILSSHSVFLRTSLALWPASNRPIRPIRHENGPICDNCGRINYFRPCFGPAVTAAVYVPQTSAEFVLYRCAKSLKGQDLKIGEILQEFLLDNDGNLSRLDAMDAGKGERTPVNTPNEGDKINGIWHLCYLILP